MDKTKRKELMDSLEKDLTLLNTIKTKYVGQQQYWIAAIIRDTEVRIRAEWNERFVDQTLENIDWNG